MGKRALDRPLGVLILAAGAGTRMESRLAKVLHPVAGAPMLTHVLNAARELRPDRTVVVIGHQGDRVKRFYSKVKGVLWVRQKEMRGTGDAVRSALGAFRDFEGPLLVLYGDIPGIRVETLRRLRMVHSSSQNTVTLLTADLEDPAGYGRIVLNPDGTVARIVEDKDATPGDLEIQEINTGIGIWEAGFLFAALRLLKPANRQKEYYLTDCVEAARNAGKSVGRFRLRDASETLGINSREDLAEVARIFYDDKALSLLKNGITLEDPATTSIEPPVEIGGDACVGAQVTIRGRSRIGGKAKIAGLCDIEASDVGSEASIGPNVKLTDAKIGSGTWIGGGTTVGSRKE